MYSCTLQAWSQNENGVNLLDNDNFDTTFITSFQDQLHVKTFIVNKSNEFSVTDVNNSITTEYRPNSSADLGFGFNYKSFGLALAFIPMGNQNHEKYGRTSKFDIQGNFYTRHLGFDVRLQRYKGYYIDNAYSLNPAFGIDSIIPLRADIRTFTMGGNAFYVFNGKSFSFKNTFTHTEWQKKSKGSWYAGTSMNLFRITGDSAIAPNELIDSIVNTNYFKQIGTFSWGGFGGYAYTLVFAKNFYLSLALAPGFAWVNIRGVNGIGQEAENANKLAFTFNSRMGIGYNSKRFYGGINGSWDSSNFSYGRKEGRVDYTTGSLRFYFGMRFESSFISKRFNGI